MSLLKSLLCILFLTGGTGCITDHQLRNTYRKSLAASSFAKDVNIDGRYHNHDTSASNTLSAKLFFWHGFNYTSLVKDDSVVAISLHYDGKRHLHVTAQDRAGNHTEVTLRVKNREGYLSIKRKLYLIPIPFFLFIQHEQKTILAINAEGDLVAVYGSKQFAWILLAAGHDEQTVSVFTRL